MKFTKRKVRAFCTTREAAELLGISVRTAQLWCEGGILDAWKTVGGHRRITRESIVRLLRIADTVVPSTPSPRYFATPGAGRPIAGTGSGFRVLVVEDDESLRRLYAFRLKRWVIRPLVETVGNGNEALVRLAEGAPDMMILDLNLPGPSGFHLLRSIYQAAEPEVPVIAVVSGLGRDEIERRGGIPVGVPLFGKPVPFNELAALAQTAIARRDAPADSDLPEPNASRRGVYPMKRDPEEWQSPAAGGNPVPAQKRNGV